jgi:hypothetical protein
MTTHTSPAAARIEAQRAEASQKLTSALSRLAQHHLELTDCDHSAPMLAGLASLISMAALDVSFHAKQIAIIDTGHHPLAGE